jgi:hypothetical protein
VDTQTISKNHGNSQTLRGKGNTQLYPSVTFQPQIKGEDENTYTNGMIALPLQLIPSIRLLYNSSGIQLRTECFTPYLRNL